MKILRPSLVLGAVIIVLLGLSMRGGAQTAGDGEGLRVVVTSKPIHSLVADVMKGGGTPALLVEGTASPHTYAMRPSDAQKVNRADVFFRVSEALEPFTGRVVKSLPRSVVVSTLADAPQVKRLDRRVGGPFEEKAGGKGGKGHSHRDHDHGSAGAYDPHVWLDPGNAKAMTRTIAEILGKARPDLAAQFTQNANRLMVRIDQMATAISAELAPVADKPFIVLHDAYQYFEKRFGLNAIGSIMIDPDERPSAKRISDLRRRLSEFPNVCVFSEPNHQQKIVETVVEGTRSRMAVLDPEGTLIEAGPQLYVLLMERLANGMKGCLSREG